MHDLTPRTALGGTSPRESRIGDLTLTENDGLSLASVAARKGREEECARALAGVLDGPPPGPGKARLHDPEAGFWIGPDQWMIGAPAESHPDLTARLLEALGDAASVTEQTGGWVAFDIVGPSMQAMCERLCALPIRSMVAGDAARTTIHHMAAYVICREDPQHIRIFAPRSSAGSFWHALQGAARSIA